MSSKIIGSLGDGHEYEKGKMNIAKKNLRVFKKCLHTSNKEGIIVTLLIPKGTKFYVSDFGWSEKCRAERAIVLDTQKQRAHSAWNWDFIYKKGETVVPFNYFSRKHETCAGGIHFFFTRKQAQKYRL